MMMSPGRAMILLKDPARLATLDELASVSCLFHEHNAVFVMMIECNVSLLCIN